jgi:hypothetical protein
VKVGVDRLCDNESGLTFGPQNEDLPTLPFSGFLHVLSHIQATEDLVNISESIPDGHCVDLFPLKLYLREELQSVLKSYHVASSSGPATVNVWFADALRKVALRRKSLDNLMQCWLNGQIPLPRRWSQNSPRVQHPYVGLGSPGDPSQHTPVSGRSTYKALDADESDDPVHQCLASYADAIIRHSWDGGRAISEDSYSQFAVSVLVTVRAQFYNFREEADQVRDLASLHQSQSERPPAPRLTLKNMKWVYDNRVKPFAEKYDKQPFRCNAGNCKTQQRKTYNLEGIMMHFGSKHTSDFSKGKKIVDWDNAEWPRIPPFTALNSASRSWPLHQTSPAVYSPWNSPQATSSTPFSPHHTTVSRADND